MSWSIDFAPFVPVWLIGLLAAAGLALIVFAASRRVAATWLRAGAIAALAIALLNPIVVAEDREPLPTTVAIVVDRSASQTLETRTEATEAARMALAAALAELGDIDLRTITVLPDGTADGTELFAAVNAGLADVPRDRLGGVVMITDGQVHDIPNNLADLGGAPLHALITGRPDEIDRRIEIDAAPRFGIVGEEQEITFRVVDAGIDMGQSTTVAIYRDGERIAERTAVIGETETYRFEVPRGGEMVFELVAETIPGELTETNNRGVVQIEGVRENLRVLLVSGEPHAGERTWRDLLKSDASVDLVHFTILRPAEKFDATPQEELALIAFPTRELFVETIDDFDLIIFDRYQQQGALPVEYFRFIADYVLEGGALLIAAGPDDAGPTSIYATDLATVLPLSPTGQMIEVPYHATITDLGLRHPVTRNLPGGASDPPAWSRWFRIAGSIAPIGDVIMEGPEGAPLLVLGHEGEGRVAMLMSDHAWLWARGFEGGGPYVDLLRRIAHWLMREPELEEEALRATAEAGILTIERQTMTPEPGTVTVETPLGEEMTVPLTEAGAGLWIAELAAETVGIWRISDGDRIAVAHVGPPNPREYVDPRSTEALLAAPVDEGGGFIGRIGPEGTDLPRLAAVSGSGNYGGNRLGIRMTEASTLLGIDRYPLFLGFLGLALATGFLAATWFREGR